jgi:hypothetical protein
MILSQKFSTDNPLPGQQVRMMQEASMDAKCLK